MHLPRSCSDNGLYVRACRRRGHGGTAREGIRLQDGSGPLGTRRFGTLIVSRSAVAARQAIAIAVGSSLLAFAVSGCTGGTGEESATRSRAVTSARDARERPSTGGLAETEATMTLSLPKGGARLVSIDPVAGSGATVRLAAAPWTIRRACRRLQASVSFTVLCPALLPRPILGFPGRAPPALRSQILRVGRDGPVGLDIGYGAPWEPGGGAGWRAHRWRNRPCCFLHFVIQRVTREAGGVPAGARPWTLGGVRGRLLPASRESFYGLYFANHVRFFFLRGGTTYAATLHTFGNRATTELLGRILVHLRPAAELGSAPSPPGRTIFTGRVGAVDVTTGAGAVWVAVGGSIMRIDPKTGRVVASLRGGLAEGVNVGRRAVWLAGARGNPKAVMRIDRRTNRVEAVIPAGTWPRRVAVGPSGVWVVNSAPFFKRGTLVRIDPASNHVVGKPVRLGPAPSGIVVGVDSVWVTDALEGTVRRIDPATARIIATIPVGRYPYGIAFGMGSIWVTNTDDNTVSRIERATSRVIATIPVGREPYGIAVARGSVWVANLGDGTVARIDPEMNRAAGQPLRFAGEPLAIASGLDGLWVTDNSAGTVTRLDVSAPA
jgi:YVTN family beta-propeller protein